MEKQIIFRSVGQNLPFFIVLAGSVVDGQFIPSEDTIQTFVKCMGTPSTDCIYRSELMGHSYVIARSDVNALLKDYYYSDCCRGIEIYDGFVVLKFKDPNESEEKTSEKE